MHLGAKLMRTWAAGRVFCVLHVGLCRAWASFLTGVHKWNDACEGVEAEWQEGKKFIISSLTFTFC